MLSLIIFSILGLIIVLIKSYAQVLERKFIFPKGWTYSARRISKTDFVISKRVENFRHTPFIQEETMHKKVSDASFYVWGKWLIMDYCETVAFICILFCNMVTSHGLGVMGGPQVEF